jgi:hypothetical protein
MARVSEHARQCATRLFLPEELPEVIRILEQECGEYGERIQCAVLKISKGKISELIRAATETKIDFRDVLMAAGFGYDVDAHKKWNGEI